ncbi:uncharacterized protein [Notothenia coriiceps]|uniref:Cytokine receptor common subunit beta N-terminal domain-containing protein n=1 Tax=Notothenia coriiceps TaxID=8208 RepID=A0A6I9NGY1_9TELE|nr:PREDICTED: uncharacterized protein LOC104949132 [Notothenia coriiceps]
MTQRHHAKIANRLQHGSRSETSPAATPLNNLEEKLLVSFYRCSIESVLAYCLTTWCASCSEKDRKPLQRVFNTAQKVIGCSLPSLEELFSQRCLNRAGKIVADSSHPGHFLFALLPSGDGQQEGSSKKTDKGNSENIFMQSTACYWRIYWKQVFFLRLLDDVNAHSEVYRNRPQTKRGSWLCVCPGMMPLYWVMLWSTLPPLVLCCAPDRCSVHESSSNVSPLLKSLQCHNDYKSHVLCSWREHRNTTLTLWFKTEDNREQCLPCGAEDEREHRTVQCRYETRTFAIGIKHTVFFLENNTLCSSVPHKPLDLSQHLRARPPVNLSSHDGGDGGRRLSWSSPYPSSSSLNRNLTYQLSYRTHGQDKWTVSIK